MTHTLCPACGQSPHAFMRFERVFAWCFNGMFAVVSFLTAPLSLFVHTTVEGE